MCIRNSSRRRVSWEVAGGYSLLRFALHPPKAAGGWWMEVRGARGLRAPGLRVQAGSGGGRWLCAGLWLCGGRGGFEI